MTKQREAEQRQTAANLLEGLLEGSISASEAIQRWPVVPGDELIERIRCLLYHYRDDEDVRARDKKYAEWQCNEFRTLLSELKGH